VTDAGVNVAPSNTAGAIVSRLKRAVFVTVDSLPAASRAVTLTV